MSQQLSLFSDDQKMAKMKATIARLHEENARLREKNTQLKTENERLHDEADKNWVLFYRHMDAVPENYGPKRFAIAMLESAVRLAAGDNVPDDEKKLANDWLFARMPAPVISAQDICSVAGFEHSKLLEQGPEALLRPKIRRL